MPAHPCRTAAVLRLVLHRACWWLLLLLLHLMLAKGLMPFLWRQVRADKGPVGSTADADDADDDAEQEADSGGCLCAASRVCEGFDVSVSMLNNKQCCHTEQHHHRSCLGLAAHSSTKECPLVVVKQQSSKWEGWW